MVNGCRTTACAACQIILPAVNMDTDYKLIRSARRTLSLEVRADLTVLVRAPERCPRRDIDAFVRSRADWIAAHLEKMRLRAALRPEPTAQEREELIRRAREYLPQRTAYYASIMGVMPSSVKITDAKKCFGSCSPGNGICYSWRLMQYPRDAVDYVTVHELAHIVHKNHGRDFYALIEKILPDYRERRKLLKE